MVWLETPTNPLMKLVDIQKVAEPSKERHSLAVDNTFNTLYSDAFRFRLQILMHSATKYLVDILMSLQELLIAKLQNWEKITLYSVCKWNFWVSRLLFGFED